MEYEKVKAKVLEEQRKKKKHMYSDLVDRFGIWLFLILGAIIGFSGNVVIGRLYLVVSILFGLDLTIERRFRTLDGKLDELLVAG